ncbi:hypothetical protein I3U33_27185 (plasmid) [Mycobacteroides abscessus subsp. abscessus]|nr:hypothetical protein I3U33_27185 [Mycobacteroides abscessus subsp. abscessus]
MNSSMSSNSFKGQARRRQKGTGVAYMRARRQVDNRGRGDAARVVPESADGRLMLSLLGLGGVEVADIAALWADRALPVGTDDPVDRGVLLRVPLGLGVGGVPVWLDLKDEADGGVGPHLLQTGMTGSGKTVGLKSMLVGLCAQHSPDLMQMVIVDTKDGVGSVFDGFADYPHTVAILGSDSCAAALMELVDGRSRALHEAGVGGRIGRYRELRASVRGADLPALPDLVVVVDEFRVLPRSVARRLMREGTGLGIHVVAVSQASVGESREVAVNVNCRIVLRTSTVQESVQLVGSADAHELSAGVGLFVPKLGAEPMPFRGFWVDDDLIVDLGRRFGAVGA